MAGPLVAILGSLALSAGEAVVANIVGPEGQERRAKRKQKRKAQKVARRKNRVRKKPNRKRNRKWGRR